MNYQTRPVGRLVEGRQPSTPETPTNASVQEWNNNYNTSPSTTLRVEPVLCTILHGKGALNTGTRLGRVAAGSVYSEHVLVVALNGVELQPCDATHLIGSESSILWRSTLDSVRLGLYVAVVALWCSQIEHGHLVASEIVVARGALCSCEASGDGVVQGEVGHVGHDFVVEPCGVACRVEQGGFCAVGYGHDVCGGGGARVVLCAAANGDVA
jgi:hypothetical protein